MSSFQKSGIGAESKADFGDDAVMNGWQRCSFPDSLVKSKVSKNNQIPKKKIIETDQFPVVDQGQRFIAGYCDDEDKLINFDLPLVVFWRSYAMF